MFAKEIYGERRAALIERLADVGGVVLIPGNELSPNSYANNSYYFRQDSNFRYLFGLDLPSLWGVIDVDSGVSMLYGRDSTLDDIIWTGELPTLAELAHGVDVEATFSLERLVADVAKWQGQFRKIHITPPYRGESKIALAELLSISVAEISNHLSPDLIFALAAMRERKGDEELAELESTYRIGYEMHTTAMQMTRPSVIEREIGGALEGIARRLGGGVSFPPIVTQHGETLHNTSREGVLESGRLLLCDAGGESLEGYCSDHTRSYPINGRFSDIQRDIYNIVLSAHNHICSIARPSMLYAELQRECYRVLGDGLRAIGLLRGSDEAILDSGAVSLFMPHGVGHGLGLDVHDCEGLGERSFDVARYADHAKESTSCIIRSTWLLQPRTVLTNEPGIYFIPQLVERRRVEGFCSDIIDYDKVLRYLDFGGIRVEDDLIITDDGCREIGASFERRIPTTIDEIEEFMRR